MPHHHLLRALCVLSLTVVAMGPARADLPGTLHHTTFSLAFGHQLIERDSLIPMLGDTTQRQDRRQPAIDTLTSFDVQSVVPGSGSCVYIQGRARVQRLILFGPERGTLEQPRDYVQLYRTCDGGENVEHLGTLFIPDGYNVRNLITDADYNPILSFDPQHFYESGKRSPYYAITRRYDARTERWDSEYARGTDIWTPESALDQVWWRSRDTGNLSASKGTTDGGRTFSDLAYGGIGLFGAHSDSVKFNYGAVYRRQNDGTWTSKSADIDVSPGGPFRGTWFDGPDLLISTGLVQDGDWAVARTESIDPLAATTDGNDTWIGTTTDAVLFYLNENERTEQVAIMASTDLGFTVDTIAATRTLGDIVYARSYARGPSRFYMSERFPHESRSTNDPTWRDKPDTIAIWHYEPAARYPTSVRWPRNNASDFATSVRFVCPASDGEPVEVWVDEGDRDTVYQWTGPTAVVPLTKRWHSYQWRYRIRRGGNWSPWSSTWTVKTASLLHWTVLENPYSRELFEPFRVIELDNGLLVCTGKAHDTVCYVSTTGGTSWKLLHLNGYPVLTGSLLGVGSRGFMYHSRAFDGDRTVPPIHRFVRTDGEPSETVPTFSIDNSIAVSNGTVYSSYSRGIRRSLDHGRTWDSISIAGPNPRAMISGFLPTGEMFVSVFNKNLFPQQRTVDTVGVVVDTSTFTIDRWMITTSVQGSRSMVDPVYLTDSLWLCLLYNDPNGLFLGRTTDAGATWERLVLPFRPRSNRPENNGTIPLTMAMVKDSLVLLMDDGRIMGTFDGASWFDVNAGIQPRERYLSSRRGRNVYTIGSGRQLMILIDVAQGEQSPFWFEQSPLGDDGGLGAQPDLERFSVREPKPRTRKHSTRVLRNSSLNEVAIPLELQTHDLNVRQYDHLGRLLTEKTLPAGTTTIQPERPNGVAGIVWVHLSDLQGRVTPLVFGLLP